MAILLSTEKIPFIYKNMILVEVHDSTNTVCAI